jgi:hypothetical protein
METWVASMLQLCLVGGGHDDEIGQTAETSKIRRFTKDCHDGIVIHGTFILGLRGETKETIEETIRFAKEINLHNSGIARCAMPRLPLRPGAREQMAARRGPGALDRAWDANRAAVLSAFEPYRDLRLGGSIL